MGGISGTNHGGPQHDLRRSHLRALFLEFSPHVVEVLPWTVNTNSATHFFNTTDEREIFTHKFIDKWPCTQGAELRGAFPKRFAYLTGGGDCEVRFLGHQCYPSYVTLASEHVMRQLAPRRPQLL